MKSSATAMKLKAVYFIFILVALYSCWSKPAQKDLPGKPQLFVLVYDISKSNESYAILHDEHLKQVYEQVGRNGGGKFYGVLINSNSNKQEPFSAIIPALDTLPVRGNRIQQAKIEKKNLQISSVFHSNAKSFVEPAAATLIKEKRESFSDIQNALLLVKQIVEMPDYKDWSIRVLIISDMMNDLPPVNGTDVLKPVVLNAEVYMGIVRPSSKVDLATLFQKLPVTNYATIKDGIYSLIEKK